MTADTAIEREWMTAAGLRALVLFQPDAGVRTAYVILPRSHSWARVGRQERSGNCAIIHGAAPGHPVKSTTWLVGGGDPPWASRAAVYDNVQRDLLDDMPDSGLPPGTAARMSAECEWLAQWLQEHVP